LPRGTPEFEAQALELDRTLDLAQKDYDCERERDGAWDPTVA